MNSKPNPCIDLEFQPFLAVWQKIAFSIFLFGEIAVKYSIFFQFLKARYQNVLNKRYYSQKNTKILKD